ncbi:alpha/beta hydrolase [Alteromonas portus]|uniref:Alpha/beta hydrolase n=1 Tax=Alteromonas portus TaxID=2565549 RepID=A0A4V5NPU7_9ALTE|nr:alpha/beta hydrolase [Alteromonas portus]TKB00726.1 alpha/beta hydrolase [Alteromonas portus]
MAKQRLLVNDTEVIIDGDGNDTILMIHGWPDNSEIWNNQVAAFRTHFRCVRFTLPGFSSTDTCISPSLEELIELFKQITVSVSPNKPIILMIHDWGSLFGYHFYNQYPDLIAKIISVDIGDWKSWQDNSSLYTKSLAFMYQITLALSWKINGLLGTSITHLLAHMFGSPTHKRHISANMNYPYWYFWFGGRQNYKRQFRDFNPSCPFLFIYGENKPMSGHDSQWLSIQTAKSGNESHSIKADHWLMNKASSQFNEIVWTWLKKNSN